MLESLFQKNVEKYEDLSGITVRAANNIADLLDCSMEESCRPLKSCMEQVLLLCYQHWFRSYGHDDFQFAFLHGNFGNFEFKAILIVVNSCFLIYYLIISCRPVCFLPWSPCRRSWSKDTRYYIGRLRFFYWAWYHRTTKYHQISRTQKQC